MTTIVRTGSPQAASAPDKLKDVEPGTLLSLHGAMDALDYSFYGLKYDKTKRLELAIALKQAMALERIANLMEKATS